MRLTSRAPTRMTTAVMARMIPTIRGKIERVCSSNSRVSSARTMKACHFSLYLKTPKYPDPPRLNPILPSPPSARPISPALDRSEGRRRRLLRRPEQKCAGLHYAECDRMVHAEVLGRALLDGADGIGEIAVVAENLALRRGEAVELG